MKINISNRGRITRLFSAGLSSYLWSQHFVQGWLMYAGIVATVILLITSFVGFCPLYKIFGIKTTQENDHSF